MQTILLPGYDGTVTVKRNGKTTTVKVAEGVATVSDAHAALLLRYVPGATEEPTPSASEDAAGKATTAKPAEDAPKDTA